MREPMTFTEEMDFFWAKTGHPLQRKWMESHHEDYQRAVQREDAEAAQRLVCDIFTGTERQQINHLEKLGVGVIAFVPKPFVVPLG